MQKYIIISSIKNTYNLLTSGQRKKSILLIIFILINGFLDVFGLAAILPFVYIISDPAIIQENHYINYVYELLGFQSNEYFLIFIILALFALFLVKNLIAIYLLYVQSRFSYNIANGLSYKLFQRYYSKGFLFFKRSNSNNLSINIATVPTDFSMGILLPIYALFSEFIVLLIMVTGILIYDYKILLLISVVMLPVVFLYYRSLKKKLDSLGREKLKERTTLYKNLYECLHGFIDVKISGNQAHFFNRYFKHQKRLFNIYTKLYTFENSPNRIIESAAFLGITVISLYAILIVNNPGILLATLTLYVTAAYRLMPSLNRILVSMMKIKSSNYVFDVLNAEITNTKSLETKKEHDSDEFEFNKTIKIENICFSYDEKKNHIDNVSLNIEKGSVIGFVGKSGSGKTTFFNIVLGLIRPQKGNILIDDRLLVDKDIDQWHRMFGYVSQEYYLIDSSLVENIAFGVDPDSIDYQKIEQSVKMASLQDVVDSLPEGLQTKIGEHGDQLSGGQKQRIAIARALYFDKEIFLFDEATNSLDSKTEKEILNAIDVLKNNNKTVLIISHGVSSLKNCNTVYEFHEGRIKNTSL